MVRFKSLLPKSILAISLTAISALAAPAYLSAQQGQIQGQVQGQIQGQAAVPNFTHPETVAADLERLDLALNNTGTLQGRFSQTGSDGSLASGTLYLQRPGKIRFEYDAPNSLLLVSDGVTIQQTDTALGTSDRIPLSSTPLDFFLKQSVSLARDTHVLSLQKYAGETHVNVVDASGQAQGNMTLIFNEPNLALKEWRVTDEFGTTTRVSLSQLVYNQQLDPRLFILDNSRTTDRRRRD